MHFAFSAIGAVVAVDSCAADGSSGMKRAMCFRLRPRAGRGEVRMYRGIVFGFEGEGVGDVVGGEISWTQSRGREVDERGIVRRTVD